jgi:hypothetical protein
MPEGDRCLPSAQRLWKEKGGDTKMKDLEKVFLSAVSSMFDRLKIMKGDILSKPTTEEVQEANKKWSPRVFKCCTKKFSNKKKGAQQDGQH